MQHALDDANDFSTHHLRLRLSKSLSDEECSGEDGVGGRNVLQQQAQAQAQQQQQQPMTSPSTSSSPSSDQSDEDETVAAVLRLTPGASGSIHSYVLVYLDWDRTPLAIVTINSRNVQLPDEQFLAGYRSLLFTIVQSIVDGFFHQSLRIHL